MCESCPNCPECGQTVPQTAKVSYWAGLIAPTTVAISVLWLLVPLDIIHIADWSLFTGFFLGVGYMLVRTDEHLSEVEWL